MALNETRAPSGLGQGRRVLEERYELVDRIGAGGMAEVWRARDLRLNRDVAVKLLPATPREDDRRRKIEREARALAAASHPNIVAVYDYGEAPGEDDDCVPYLVMELIDGKDLHQHVTDRGPLPVDEARNVLAGVLAAVTYAHRAGVVHGDLKPANIFMGPHGPKVGDFGVARILDEQSTGTTTVAATPAFAAPEVLRGERATPASDVYSAACLAFELLTGRPPFEGTNAWEVASKHMEEPIPKLRRVRSDVPADLEATIARGMAKDPKRRYADAASFAEALGEPVPEVSTPEVSSTVDETIPLAAPVAAVVEPTQAISRPIRKPRMGLPFGRRVRERSARAVRSSPNGRILLVLLIPVLLLIAFLAMRDPGPVPRAVPDLVGVSYQQATNALKAEGFKVDVSFRPVTDSEQAGRVLQTLPEADTKVDPGSEVHLIAGAMAATPTPAVETTKGDDDDGNTARELRRARGKGRNKD